MRDETSWDETSSGTISPGTNPPRYEFVGRNLHHPDSIPVFIIPLILYFTQPKFTAERRKRNYQQISDSINSNADGKL